MTRPIFVCIAIFLAVISAIATAAENTLSKDGLLPGEPILNVRIRHEYADQDGKYTGHATTLRTLAGWRSGSWHKFSGIVELIDVGRLNNDYNDNLNGKTRYPVIADPDNTDINQLYLDYGGWPDTVIRAGRQSIKLDNMRFVGNVEFRQVMQVFNGVTLENKGLPDTRIYAGYLGRIKTVSNRQFETDTILLNVRYSFSPTETLAVYGYFQDQPNAIAPSAFGGTAPSDTSNRIIGIRLDGNRPLDGQWQFVYTGEVARQRPHASGDDRIDAMYLRIGIGGQWRGYLLRIDEEILDSNQGQYAVQFPLATNHLFQGWADQFLVTPRQGIRDVYFTGGAKIGKFQFLAEYHHFNSDVADINIGKEFDFSAAYPFTPNLLGKVEIADFRARDTPVGKTDLQRTWMTVVLNY
ncbi:MAG: alginate export family protein [Burkholderiales bacterium]